VKVVDTERKVDTFVSRLDPHTDVSELVDCVDSIKGDMLKLQLALVNSCMLLAYLLCLKFGQLVC